MPIETPAVLSSGHSDLGSRLTPKIAKPSAQSRGAHRLPASWAVPQWHSRSFESVGIAGLSTSSPREGYLGLVVHYEGAAQLAFESAFAAGIRTRLTRRARWAISAT